MTTTNEVTLSICRTFDASPSDVFRACTDPEQMKQWWGPPGYTTPMCEMDVRVGGQYFLTMKGKDGPEHALRGVYREIVPDRRLVYTFVWQEGDYAHHEMLVTLELHAKNGGTELVFTQEKLPTAKAREEHDHGWSGSFDRLAELVQ